MRVCRPWTEADMNTLREYYPVEETPVVASRLGRSALSVSKQAGLHGIYKTQEALQKIRSLAAQKEPGRSALTRFKPTHGRATLKAGAYRAWLCMKQRCEYERHKSYPSYGGRGIGICARWKESFVAFLEDMGECPPGYTLGRINNDDNYEPGNCRWETVKQQARNRRSTRWVLVFGERRAAAEWCELFGISQDTFRWRVKNGMSAEKALLTPVQDAGPRSRARKAMQ